MSRIKELEIWGVRNFGDPSSKVKVYFSTPLTLILGKNGTGKTAIIESLRYATTGYCPPDTEQGKSFLHEPNLTRSTTVSLNFCCCNISFVQPKSQYNKQQTFLKMKNVNSN